MWEKIRIIFTIPELRQKIALTVLLLAVFRLGSWIPLPIIDQNKLEAVFGRTGGAADMLAKVAMFSASDLDQATIFGLGIMPYISASIILQLGASVWKPLEDLQKEGEAGRKKINEYTRYLTVFLCVLQSWFYVDSFIEGNQLVQEQFLVAGKLALTWQVLTVTTMTAGTIFLMWLGEQIDEFGIGNGISLLIMAGILCRMPNVAIKLFSPLFSDELSFGSTAGTTGVDKLLVLLLLFVAVICGVIFVTQAQRRIHTQSTKHVRGRRVYGGTRQYLPLKVNQSGVMPIIFASSLLMVPALLFTTLASMLPHWRILIDLNQAFQGSSYLYNLLYVLLIFAFCYLWTAITFNPKDMAENLKSYGSFIPGYRPGKRTADYLEKVMVRITYVGAGFLAVVAILPSLVASALSIDYLTASFFGGTGLLIAVSVVFDLVQKIDSHLVMRNYRGLLEKS
jgi:preprotein translocase subunit SecY